jgi:hypothetical protein
MTISRLKDIRTDVGEVVRRSAAAVVGEAGEITAADQLEVVPDDVQARRVVGTEPAKVPVRAARDAHKVSVGIGSEGLGVNNGGLELRLHGRRTAGEEGPLVVDARDGEVTRELNCSNALNGGAEVLGGAAGIDVGKEVRWPDGVVSGARSSEVVRGGDWGGCV